MNASARECKERNVLSCGGQLFLTNGERDEGNSCQGSEAYCSCIKLGTEVSFSPFHALSFASASVTRGDKSPIVTVGFRIASQSDDNTEVSESIVCDTISTKFVIMTVAYPIRRDFHSAKSLWRNSLYIRGITLNTSRLLGPGC
jgi:hypothetical protein